MIILFQLNINIENYNKVWNQILKYLKSNESTTRYYALNFIVKIKENLSRILDDQYIAQSLFKTIYSISVADEVN